MRRRRPPCPTCRSGPRARRPARAAPAPSRPGPAPVCTSSTVDSAAVTVRVGPRDADRAGGVGRARAPASTAPRPALVELGGQPRGRRPRRRPRRRPVERATGEHEHEVRGLRRGRPARRSPAAAEPGEHRLRACVRRRGPGRSARQQRRRRAGRRAGCRCRTPRAAARPAGSSCEVSSRSWSARAGSPTASVSATSPATVAPGLPDQLDRARRGSAASAPDGHERDGLPVQHAAHRGRADPRRANSSAARWAAASASRSAVSGCTCAAQVVGLRRRRPRAAGRRRRPRRARRRRASARNTAADARPRGSAGRSPEPALDRLDELCQPG